MLKSTLEAFVTRGGSPSPLQISGGEPTLHPDLPAVIAAAAGLGFTRIEVNTNGLALSREGPLAEELRSAGLSGVYLQFDGLDPHACLQIRGRDLVEYKLRAIGNCVAAGLQVVLADTVVPGINDHLLWNTVTFALSRRLTGVVFQRFARSGRYPIEFVSGDDAPLTLRGMIDRIVEQSGGLVTGADFVPIDCSDLRCSSICYAISFGNLLLPLARVLGEQRVAKHAACLDGWDSVIHAESWLRWLAGREDVALGDSLRDAYPAGAAEFFSIGLHAMMDSSCFDRQRIDRCCVHAVAYDGMTVPLCLYNSEYRSIDGQWLEHSD